MNTFHFYLAQVKVLYTHIFNNKSNLFELSCKQIEYATDQTNYIRIVIFCRMQEWIWIIYYSYITRLAVTFILSKWSYSKNNLRWYYSVQRHFRILLNFIFNDIQKAWLHYFVPEVPWIYGHSAYRCGHWNRDINIFF